MLDLKLLKLLEMSISLFMIIDPIGVVPLFTSLTSGMSMEDKNRIIRNTSITVFSVLLISAFFGKYILSMFSINLPAFQVAGGIILLILALEMLHAFDSPMKRKPEEGEEATVRVQRDEPIWIIPLAIPMLTGPATMSTVIIYFSKFHDTLSIAWFLLTFLIIGITVFLVLKFANEITAKLGRAGINVMTRIMGLLLLAISIEMIVKGIKEIWFLS